MNEIIIVASPIVMVLTLLGMAWLQVRSITRARAKRAQRPKQAQATEASQTHQTDTHPTPPARYDAIFLDATMTLGSGFEVIAVPAAPGENIHPPLAARRLFSRPHNVEAPSTDTFHYAPAGPMDVHI